MRVFLIVSGYKFAVKIIQCGKQRDGAMPFVIMGFCANVSNSERQAWLCPFQCLALAFFITAEHYGFIRGIQIQSYHIPELLIKLRIL